MSLSCTDMPSVGEHQFYAFQVLRVLQVCDCDDKNLLDFRSSDFASDSKYMSDVTLTM